MSGTTAIERALTNMITVGEAARILGVTRARVYQLIKAKRLATVDFGPPANGRRSIGLLRDQVERWPKEGRLPPHRPAKDARRPRKRGA